MKDHTPKTAEERERGKAWFYFYFSLSFAIFFAGGCIAAIFESSNNDWFTVPFFGAMSGVCAFCVLVLGALLYFGRPERRSR